MKSFFFAFLFLVAMRINILAQILIPDVNFEQALIDKGIDSDATINGQISETDVIGVITLDVSSRNISSLTGIEQFIDLRQLVCSHNNLTNLDILTSLNIYALFCNSNQLTSLDVTMFPNLNRLWCGLNEITSLNVTMNPNLTELICNNNQLTNLDVTMNSELTRLVCSGNQIASLDVTMNPKLTELNFAGNRVEILDVTENPSLKVLNCDVNKIVSLDVTENPSLIILQCGVNQLTSLNISENPNLTRLFCGANQIASLDLISNPKLEELSCIFNQLTNLDVRNGNNTLINSFNAQNNPKLKCILVDDVAFSNANWQKDAAANFTTDPTDPICEGCGDPSVRLIGLEVTQTIQDLRNSVTLIENKKTFVRAHIQSLDNVPHKADAKLEVYDENGTKLGSCVPLNTRHLALPAGQLDRSRWDHSLNYELPSNWIKGKRTFRLDNSFCGICAEPAEIGGVGADCEVEVEFYPTSAFNVRFVKINWFENGDLKGADEKDVIELRNRLKDIFPVSRIERFSSKPLILSNSSLINNVVINDKLLVMQTADYLFGNDPLINYYGIVKGEDIRGFHLPFSKISTGSMPSYHLSIGRNTHAHELAHSLGLEHTRRANGIISFGFCGEKGKPGQLWDYSYIQNIRNQMELKAAIGPETFNDLNQMYNPNTIWGINIDFIAKEKLASTLPSGSRIYTYYDGSSIPVVDANENIDYRVIDPKVHFELMSYCEGPVNQYRWISDINYHRIKEEINSASFTQKIVNSNSTEYRLIRGSLSFTNDIADFSPFLIINSKIEPPVTAQGDYNLIVKNVSGNVITSESFGPEELIADLASNPSVGLFSIFIPESPDIYEVEIFNNNKIIGTISSSKNIPTIIVKKPNGDENLSGSEVFVEWYGKDLDGDQLFYTVQYSSDDGETWSTLVVDYTESNITINKNVLEGSYEALFRVFASDGFNSAYDVSDKVFTISNNYPEANIIAPINYGQYVLSQTVIFEGWAFDSEDLNLSGSSISWTSNIDGVLGIGESFHISSDLLSEGQHLITLTAIDSDGASSSAEVLIQISHSTDPKISQTDLDGDDLPDIAHQCDCENYNNIVDEGNNITHLSDFITITSGPGETWQLLKIYEGEMFTIDLIKIPVGTVIPEVRPGVYQLFFYYPDGIGFHATFDRIDGGASFPLTTQRLCNSCNMIKIPTIGQWGLIILVLLFLTFGATIIIHNRNSLYKSAY